MTTKNAVTNSYLILNTINGPELAKFLNNKNTTLVKSNGFQNLKIVQIAEHSSSYNNKLLWGIDDQGFLYRTYERNFENAEMIKLKHPVIDMAPVEKDSLFIVYDTGYVALINAFSDKVIDIYNLKNINNVYFYKLGKEGRNKFICCAVSENKLYIYRFDKNGKIINTYKHKANDTIVYVNGDLNVKYKWYLTALGDVFAYVFNGYLLDNPVRIERNVISLSLTPRDDIFITNNTFKKFVFSNERITTIDFDSCNIDIIYVFSDYSHYYFVDNKYKIYIGKKPKKNEILNNIKIKNMYDSYGNIAILYHQNIKSGTSIS